MFVTPKAANTMLRTVLKAGLVPFLQSSPGLGKSSIVKQIAKDQGLKVIDIRLAQVDPTELNGFPAITNGLASYIPMDIFPLEDTPIPKGFNGWLLFLDEMSSAPPAVQAAAYKLILDHMVGQKKLHEDVYIVAAGNLVTDSAVVHHMSTAIQSRVVHIFLEASLEDFKEWAYHNNISSNVISFLNFRPEYLHKFDPNADDHTFACPRTWEFASNIEQALSPKAAEYSNALFCGTLGNGVGTEFATFIKIQADIITYEEILLNPANCRIPSDPSTQWALVGSLVAKVDKKDIGKVMTFIKRLSIEFQVIFIKDLYLKSRDIATNSVEINEWVSLNATRFA